MRSSAGLADLPEIAALKRRRKRLLIALLALLVLGALTAKPAYRAAKAWRCRVIAAESGQLLEQGKLDEAFDRARAAHQLLPTEPAALRAVARVMAERGDWATAASFWAEFSNRASMSSADRRAFAETALRSGGIAAAQEQIAALLSSEPGVTENHLLAARLKLLQRDWSGAVAAVRTAILQDPADESAPLLLGELLLQRAESRGEGLRQLQELATRPSKQGLLALTLLAAQGDLAAEDARQIAAALEAHPLATQPHHLKALELRLRAAPEQRGPLLDAAQARYAAAEPEALRGFAAWLVAHREPERVLAMLPMERAFTRRDLLLVRLDAMAALAQWSEILAVLDRDRVPLEATLLHLFRARCRGELGERTLSDVAWRAAITAGAGDPNALLYVASYAEKIGAREHAERAYRSLAENPRTARLAYDALLRLTPPKDTKALRDLLSEMVVRWPKDTAISNDLAYLNALLGVDLEKARDTALTLVQAAPHSLPHRTALALAELRLGRAAEAAKVYDGLRIDWQGAAPGAVAVYSAVLRANGRAAEAAPLLAALPAEALRPEEQALWDSALEP